MPVVEITLIEGRNDEAKARLHAKVAAAIHEAIDAPKESIRIIIREVPGVHFSVGGVAKASSTGKS
ncbi:2-hydroxymuconate tautomerase [Rhodoblastus sp.]|jgi:4-oxalocrotonate tautomerase|uniref:2-hydroxymuconate tautomerase n=1 Tax=Rhodoblastus sp. TaxID=1962975 RepID=UPI00262822BC|nr:2-hydroxymuconate tautomerase [Rhodoblastus sp.]